MLSCSYFVTHPNGVILIDSGMDVDGEEMRFGLNEQGLDFPDVQSILITHWHNDHTSGAAAIRNASGADVMSHPASVDRLARKKMATGLRGMIAQCLPIRGFLGSVRGLLELAPPRAVDVTKTLEDGDQILDFKVIETPGHVDGHISFFYEPEGVLFTGDALAVAHDKLSFMSRFLTEDKEAARTSMLRCLDLAPEAYCPGHRAPLVNPPVADIRSLRNRLENLRWWPIIGCGE
jgi:glyoxylase-like metal-dependent hydrolase (beta-lactamase superfamily II)